MSNPKLPNRISYDKILEELSTLEIKKNRINAQLNISSKKIDSKSQLSRKKRTRTLIQLGGLVTLSGLSSICDITEGDDLQEDLHNMDKAATLLGILMTCVENMREDLDENSLHIFKDKGVRFLKMNSYYSRHNDN